MNKDLRNGDVSYINPWRRVFQAQETSHEVGTRLINCKEPVKLSQNTSEGGLFK